MLELSTFALCPLKGDDNLQQYVYMGYLANLPCNYMITRAQLLCFIPAPIRSIISLAPAVMLKQHLASPRNIQRPELPMEQWPSL